MSSIGATSRKFEMTFLADSNIRHLRDALIEHDAKSESLLDALLQYQPSWRGKWLHPTDLSLQNFSQPLKALRLRLWRILGRDSIGCWQLRHLIMVR